jgi:hypothetical protein
LSHHTIRDDHQTPEHPPLSAFGADQERDGMSIQMCGNFQRMALTVMSVTQPGLCRICASNIILNAAHMQAAQIFIGVAARFSGPGTDRAAFLRLAGSAYDTALRAIEAGTGIAGEVPEHITAYAAANTAERVQ